MADTAHFWVQVSRMSYKIPPNEYMAASYKHNKATIVHFFLTNHILMMCDFNFEIYGSCTL